MAGVNVRRAADMMAHLRVRILPVGQRHTVFVFCRHMSTPEAASMKDFIQRIPKAEIHVHLEGSIGPSTLLHLARLWETSQDVTLPAAIASVLDVTPEEVETLLRTRLEA